MQNLHTDKNNQLGFIDPEIFLILLYKHCQYGMVGLTLEVTSPSNIVPKFENLSKISITGSHPVNIKISSNKDLFT